MVIDNYWKFRRQFRGALLRQDRLLRRPDHEDALALPILNVRVGQLRPRSADFIEVRSIGLL